MKRACSTIPAVQLLLYIGRETTLVLCLPLVGPRRVRPILLAQAAADFSFWDTSLITTTHLTEDGLRERYGRMRRRHRARLTNPDRRLLRCTKSRDPRVRCDDDESTHIRSSNRILSSPQSPSQLDIVPGAISRRWGEIWGRHDGPVATLAATVSAHAVPL